MITTCYWRWEKSDTESWLIGTEKKIIMRFSTQEDRLIMVRVGELDINKMFSCKSICYWCIFLKNMVQNIHYICTLLLLFFWLMYLCRIVNTTFKLFNLIESVFILCIYAAVYLIKYSKNRNIAKYFLQLNTIFYFNIF